MKIVKKILFLIVLVLIDFAVLLIIKERDTIRTSVAYYALDFINFFKDKDNRLAIGVFALINLLIAIFAALRRRKGKSIFDLVSLTVVTYVLFIGHIYNDRLKKYVDKFKDFDILPKIIIIACIVIIFVLLILAILPSKDKKEKQKEKFGYRKLNISWYLVGILGLIVCTLYAFLAKDGFAIIGSTLRASWNYLFDFKSSWDADRVKVAVFGLSFIVVVLYTILVLIKRHRNILPSLFLLGFIYVLIVYFMKDDVLNQFIVEHTSRQTFKNNFSIYLVILALFMLFTASIHAVVETIIELFDNNIENEPQIVNNPEETKKVKALVEDINSNEDEDDEVEEAEEKEEVVEPQKEEKPTPVVKPVDTSADDEADNDDDEEEDDDEEDDDEDDDDEEDDEETEKVSDDEDEDDDDDTREALIKRRELIRRRILAARAESDDEDEEEEDEVVGYKDEVAEEDASDEDDDTISFESDVVDTEDDDEEEEDEISDVYEESIAYDDEVEEAEEEEDDEEEEDEDDEDEDEDEEIVFESSASLETENPVGQKLARIKSKPLNEKFITVLDDEKKERYNTIRNELQSYKKVSERLSSKADSYRYHRGLIAKITIAGKTLRLHLALNPDDFIGSKYSYKDLSAKKKYMYTPMTIRLRSKKSVKQALELIEVLAQTFGLEKNSRYKEKDYMALIEEEFNLANVTQENND